MAKLKDGSRVYGALTVDNAIIGNTGFQNMILFTTGTAVVYTLPASLQVPGAKFKITVIGGGAGGATTAATAGTTGSGGGAGGVVSIILQVASVYTFTYTVGAAGASNLAGTLSSVVYNGVTYQASPGQPTGAGGAAAGVTNGTTLNGIGLTGFNGAPAGTNSSLQTGVAYGGDTPLGYGRGGRHGASTSSGSPGSAATGYGAGGSGGKNGSTAAGQAGGAGAPGLIILQY